MKRLIAILFLLIYTGTAARFAINYHYCCGYLAHTSILNFGGVVGCACNPKDMPKDGCKDKLIVVKSENHRSVQQTQILTAPLSSTIIRSTANQYDLAFLKSECHTDQSLYRFKPTGSQPIFLLISVFRI